jgi:transposase-like protein
MTPTKLSAEDRAEIAARYVAGLSEPQLAERFGTSRAAVRRVLDAAGVERRPDGGRRGSRPVEGPDDATIRRLRDEHGCSWATIAEYTGLSPTGVRKRYGRVATPSE